MNGSPLVFFSFVSLPGCGPIEHRRYNEWHQLDHRPENLALSGVAWGDRWARPQRCRDVSVGTGEQDDTDYVAMYWFREPVKESVADWERLGADSFQWGRGPLIRGVQRTLLAFFRPVKGYVSASALVSPAALVYRPNRGLHLTLTRYEDPLGVETHDDYLLEDRTLIPELLALPGVAGAWTLTLERHQDDGLRLRSRSGTDAPGALRMRLLYLDDDPVAIGSRVRLLTDEIRGNAAVGQVVLDTPLQTIIPWQDW